MKILHTSDWHLGQHFITKSRADEHRAFMRWLVEQVKLHEIDAVIIAGDVFDTGTPPSYARQLFNQFIVDMSKLKCQLIVLGGNHDSVATLNESRQILRHLDTEVIAGVMPDPEEQILVLNDKKGEPGAVICAVPFIRPRDVMLSQADQSGGSKQQQLGEAISVHYARLFELAQQRCQALGVAVPIIATGHLTAVGASVSDSVRDIYIGSLEAFSASHFPPADYIALGHIHRAQLVAKSEHIRYSGSPIPLSFDEVRQDKSVFLVSFEQAKLHSVEPLIVPCFQPMQSLKGDLAGIAAQLENLMNEQKPEPEAEAEETTQPIWLSIEVESQDYLTDLHQRIEQMTAELPVEVLQLRRARRQNSEHLQRVGQETLAELSVTEVFERCIEKAHFDSPEELARKARITQAFEQIVEQVQHEHKQASAEEAE